MGDMIGDLNLLQCVTTIAETVWNRGYSAGNINIFEVSAVVKSIFVYRGQTVGQVCTLKRKALLENTPVQSSQPLRKPNFSQSRTVAKCIFPDIFQSVGERHFTQRIAIMKGIMPDMSDSIRDGYRIQCMAVIAHSLRNCRQRIGKHHLRQTITVIKQSRTDTGQRVGKDYCNQCTTLIENIAPDGLHIPAHCKGLQAPFVLKCRVADLPYSGNPCGSQIVTAIRPLAESIGDIPTATFRNRHFNGVIPIVSIGITDLLSSGFGDGIRAAVAPINSQRAAFNIGIKSYGQPRGDHHPHIKLRCSAFGGVNCTDIPMPLNVIKRAIPPLKHHSGVLGICWSFGRLAICDIHRFDGSAVIINETHPVAEILRNEVVNGRSVLRQPLIDQRTALCVNGSFDVGFGGRKS